MYKSLDLWLPAYLSHMWRLRKQPKTVGPKHLIIAVCDHFEPFHHTDKFGAMKRMELWKTAFPKITQGYSDSDSLPPKHSFFYPIEQYDEDIISELAVLCRGTGSEVEVHLHHDNDTRENLKCTLEKGKEDLHRHGFLSKDKTGALRYGFIHGNWCLDNSNPEGRYCGVSDEISILAQSGCFADFTMPSAPHPTQTRTVNRIYYAIDTPEPKSHDRGYPVVAGKAFQPPASATSDAGTLLMVQGPLGLNFETRKFGILPRIENADLTENATPRPDRLRLWTRLNICVEGRPDWIFIKLHTHGAISPNAEMLLGKPMQMFHQYLCDSYKSSLGCHYHYVSAREMVNIIHAAEDGRKGNPNDYRNYRFPKPDILC